MIRLPDEVIDSHVGAEAVMRYGVCGDTRATTQNQVWLVVKETTLRRDNGGLDYSVRVVCGLCGESLNWDERDATRLSPAL